MAVPTPSIVSDLPVHTPHGTAPVINRTERPLTCENANDGTDGTGDGTAVIKSTERPLTCEGNGRNGTELSPEPLPVPRPFRAGGTERNGGTNERAGTSTSTMSETSTTPATEFWKIYSERLRAEAEQAAADVVPHPEPEVRSRPATADELTKPATALLKEAAAQGWTTTATYAKGWAEIKNRGPRLIESVVLRLRSPHGARAVVVYEDRKPREAWIWAEGFAGASASNVTTVTAMVKGTWPQPMSDTELLFELGLEDAA